MSAARCSNDERVSVQLMNKSGAGRLCGSGRLSDRLPTTGYGQCTDTSDVFCWQSYSPLLYISRRFGWHFVEIGLLPNRGVGMANMHYSPFHGPLRSSEALSGYISRC